MQPPPGWSWQKWKLIDQCCGSGTKKIILPDNWSETVQQNLAQAADIISRYGLSKVFRVGSVGEDGNSHLSYLDDGIILEQTLITNNQEEPEQKFELDILLRLKPDGKIDYHSFNPYSDRDIVAPTIEQILKKLKIQPQQAEAHYFKLADDHVV
jgi:hypothetical protein